MKKILLALIILFLASPVYAATISTAQAGNYSAGATWTGGVKPQAGDDAQIDHAVTIDENIAIDNLDNNSTLTFGGNYSMTITGGGDIDNDAGTITASNNNISFLSSNTTHWTWTINVGTFTGGTGTQHFEYGTVTCTTGPYEFGGDANGTYAFDENMTFQGDSDGDWAYFDLGTTVTVAAGKTITMSDGSTTFYFRLDGVVTAEGSSGNEITISDGGNDKGRWALNGASVVASLKFCDFIGGSSVLSMATLDGDNITIEDCSFTSGANYGLYIATLSNTLTFTRVKVYSNNFGVYCLSQTGQVVFNDSEIYINTSDGMLMYCKLGLTLNRTKVYSNGSEGLNTLNTNWDSLILTSDLIYENTHEGLQLYNTENSKIFNTTVADNGAAFPNIYVLLAAGDSLPITNLISYGAKYGIQSASGVGDPDPAVTYSDVDGATTADYFGMTDPTGTNGNISADPKFTSAATDDYHIGGGSSPCINTGTSTGAPANDIDDVAWPNANPEMGCYGEAESAAEYATAIFFGSHF